MLEFDNFLSNWPITVHPCLSRYYFPSGSDRYKQVIALARECMGRLFTGFENSSDQPNQLRGYNSSLTRDALAVANQEKFTQPLNPRPHITL